MTRKEQKELIENLATDIIIATNTSIPILSIHDFILNIKGIMIETDNYSVMRNNKSFIVTTPKTDNITGQKFRIAELLGHLFLHMGYMINDEIWNAQKNYEPYDENSGGIDYTYQANEFALALIMPKKEFIAKIEEYSNGNMVDTPKLADYFKTNINTASLRGTLFGYFKK